MQWILTVTVAFVLAEVITYWSVPCWKGWPNLVLFLKQLQRTLGNHFWAIAAMSATRMGPFFLYIEGLTLLDAPYVGVDISDLTHSLLVKWCSGTFQARSLEERFEIFTFHYFMYSCIHSFILCTINNSQCLLSFMTWGIKMRNHSFDSQPQSSKQTCQYLSANQCNVCKFKVLWHSSNKIWIIFPHVILFSLIESNTIDMFSTF